MPIPAMAPARFLACAALIAALAFTASCTIVKRSESDSVLSTAAQKAAGTKDFDPKSYVLGMWPKIEEELLRAPADLREIVEALRRDPPAAEREYGRRKEETAPFNYVVKGKARVLSVNNSSAAGYLEIDVPDLSGGANSRIQIGPVFKSTAVRDSIPFISFGDFVNQVDYANTAREINFYVRDNVIPRVDATELAGKSIAFVGAFSQDPSGTVLITPIALETEE